jgi:hypothetical protein
MKASMTTVAIRIVALIATALYLIHWFPGPPDSVSNDLEPALLLLGFCHFQFKISGRSWPCLSM